MSTRLTHRTVRARPGRRAVGVRRSPIGSSSPGRLAIAGLIAIACCGALVWALIRWSGASTAVGGTTLILAATVTGSESEPATPADLLERADALAESGTSSLVAVQAAGDGGRQAGPVTPLRVEREPGHLDNDAASRDAGVASLVAGVLAAARNAPLTGDGRDLAGLLMAISDLRGPGDNEVWLSTFGLGTTAPADARLLTAADPAQAARSVADRLPTDALARTTVHLVLDAPTGDQPWLNPRTSDWRSTFVPALLTDLGAVVASVREDLVVRPSRPGAPPAPRVENLPETNPRPPATSPAPSGPIQVPLDSAALFRPDTAAFVDGPEAASAALAPVIDAVRRAGYGHVEVVGRCAAFGAAESARALSLERATAVAQLLRQAGVAVDAADIHGVGFDSPLPPDPRSTANRSVTVTARPGA